MRAFAAYRAMLIDSRELRSEIHALDEKINRVFKYLLDKIDALHQKNVKPKRKIGFKHYDNE